MKAVGDIMKSPLSSSKGNKKVEISMKSKEINEIRSALYYNKCKPVTVTLNQLKSNAIIFQQIYINQLSAA